MTQNPPPTLNCLTVDEVAELLGVSRAGAYKLCGNGTIPCKRLGRRFVVPREPFFAWLNGGAK